MTSRHVFLIGACIAAFLFTDTAANAQFEGPWCLKVRTGRSVGERCSYGSFGACNFARSMEPGSFCVQNSAFGARGPGYGDWEVVQPRPRKIRKRHR